jgi:sulfate transport system ATP-binding protein
MNKGKVEQSGTPDQVYEHPANPFVLNFLGNVNLFHGRMQSDKGSDNSVAYVRSHDIDIDRSPQDSTALPAVVRHIQKLGPSVRITLAINENGEFLEAELTRDTFQNLGLQQGESVFVRPRQLRVFVEDYQI